MATYPDKDTILRIKRGEIEQYSVIVNRYAKRIKAFVEARLFKKDDADDIVQEIFINFYKAIPRFDAEKPILSYIYTIAHNQMKMYYRANKKTVPLKEETMVVETEENFFDDKALNILDKKDKAYLLKIADGYSYEEVAKRYRISLNTLKSRVRRARLKIKELL